jgi:PTH2 family peptidyl-tRNA hydrolase
MSNKKNNSCKQVLVVRKDLKMRQGKAIAQGSHASLGVVLNTMRIKQKGIIFTIIRFLFWILEKYGYGTLLFAYKKDSPWDKWINGRFTKICVYCKDEEELMEIYQKAKNENMPTVLITDAGLTEFSGVPTNTCIAIGPYWADEIDKITGNLPLL